MIKQKHVISSHVEELHFKDYRPDYSEYTVEQYNQITDVEEKYRCFKAMFAKINQKIMAQIGTAFSSQVPFAP